MKMHDYAFDYCEHYFFFENYMILIIIDSTKFDVWIYVAHLTSTIPSWHGNTFSNEMLIKKNHEIALNAVSQDVKFSMHIHTYSMCHCADLTIILWATKVIW